MKKIIYSLFVLLTMTTVGCDNYIDITPKGAVTVDSAQQYYELIATPMRAYYPSSFILLSDDQWVKESEILGFESISADGINFTFNEKADRTILPDNNLYENIYSFILRSNLVIDNVDKGQGSQELKTLAKAEARTFRAFDHFLAVNTFAKAYNPETAASDGGVCIMDRYDLEATPVCSSFLLDWIVRRSWRMSESMVMSKSSLSFMACTRFASACEISALVRPPSNTFHVIFRPKSTARS